MVNIKINDIDISVEEGTTIMEAAKANGINIPKLCYLKDINEISACKACVVEVKGEETLVTSCNNVAIEGMVINTNSDRVRRARRTNVELILSQHNVECASCTRAGTCALEKVATDLGIMDVPYQKDLVKGKKAHWNKDFPLQRDINKCIKCMRCAQVCEKVQSISIWDLNGSGSRTNIDVSHNRVIDESECVLCGQCITNCPTGALYERDDTRKTFDSFADPEKITVVQIAPAVRTGFTETLDGETGDLSVKKMVTALKKMGADYVFDTTFTADLTIMEEGTEFLHRFTSGDLDELPMFTSCCPGWMRFIKSSYPELTSRLSTAKSPQQMFGAVTKTWFAEKLGVDPAKIFSVSIMPCVAKKSEYSLPGMKSTEAGQDVDLVLTTREFVKMTKSESLNLFDLEEQKFDSLLGEGTGAGVIFGASGGVMEAALRSAYFLITGENPPADTFEQVRWTHANEGGYVEATYNVDGNEVKCAVVSGLSNTRNLLDAIKRGEVKYHFVEVMACPGGCAGGGGQPINGYHEADILKRQEVLYDLDKESQTRYSHENQEVTALYEAYFSKPCSEKSHHLLHVDHMLWEMPEAKRK